MSFWELLLNSRVTGNLIWVAPLILIILLFRKPIQNRIVGLKELRWQGLLAIFEKGIGCISRNLEEISKEESFFNLGSSLVGIGLTIALEAPERRINKLLKDATQTTEMLKLDGVTVLLVNLEKDLHACKDYEKLMLVADFFYKIDNEIRKHFEREKTTQIKNES